ncbi:MAG: hypothetical protein M0Q12_00165 [Synergistaceae bacterium]|jgi:hypothetical protein|nr:hypothetical protein [Synergistaceae bacterium]
MNEDKTAAEQWINGRQGKPGHPQKLNEQIHKTIMERITAGNTIEASAVSAGINKVTYYRWAQRGQKAKKELEENGHIDPADEKYIRFMEDIIKAKALSEVALVSKIHRAGETGTGDWRAYAFILERRFPDKWGRKDRLDVNLLSLSVQLALQAGLTTNDIQQVIEGSSNIETLPNLKQIAGTMKITSAAEKRDDPIDVESDG